MRDFYLCKNDDCPRKDFCYRHTAPRGYRAQFLRKGVLKPDNSCEHFIEINQRSPVSHYRGHYA